MYISSNHNDHNHIEKVVKKGNRLIAYIKSVIDHLDDFNRVYTMVIFYGDRLLSHQLIMLAHGFLIVKLILIDRLEKL